MSAAAKPTLQELARERARALPPLTPVQAARVAALLSLVTKPKGNR